ncbi:MAG: GGDEF domain-containing protein [Desulfuromonadaceae bacterium]
MNHADKECTVELSRAIILLHNLISNPTVPAEPPGDLLAVEGFADLYETLLDIRNAILATASGNLSYPMQKRGFIPGTMKIFQAALRHLTWQTKAIASGDRSQRVNFLGDFSDAFNSMVQQLDESIRTLQLREQDLIKLLRTDPLTGINNRGYFMELLSSEVERARRYDHALSVLMFDLDHFKSVNDSRGHAAGDEALKTVAAVLMSSELRINDFFGRIGGEEFAIALPETTIEGAADVAERIRENLESTPVTYDKNAFIITASIGAGDFRRGDTRETLLHRVDQAMYDAKQTGRNRVCLAP